MAQQDGAIIDVKRMEEHFSLEELREYCKRLGAERTGGSKHILALNLKRQQVRYSNLKLDHLKLMIKEECIGVSTSSINVGTAAMVLSNNPFDRDAIMQRKATKEQKEKERAASKAQRMARQAERDARQAERQRAQAAAPPAPEPAGAPPAAPAQAPAPNAAGEPGAARQPAEAAAPEDVAGPEPAAAPAAAPAGRKTGVQLLKDLYNANNKRLTLDQATHALAQHNLLPPGHAVYPIIAPITGGAEHYSNYCVLPNRFPRNYGLSVEDGALHNEMVAGLVGKLKVNTAIIVSKPPHGRYAGPDAAALVQQWGNIGKAALAFRNADADA